jgi:hypothetical protein
MAILFVGISDNTNIAYAGDDSDDASYNNKAHQLSSLSASATSVIDLTSAQGFKDTQKNTPGCDKLDVDATWCV